MGFNGWEVQDPNENMFVNPRFVINQRGEATYEIGNQFAYTLDMVKILKGKLTILNEGINFASTNDNENYKRVIFHCENTLQSGGILYDFNRCKDKFAFWTSMV